MADPTLDLHYGHLGSLTYTGKGGIWSTQSKSKPRGQLRCLTAPEIHITAARTTDLDDQELRSDNVESEMFWRDLRHLNPGLVPTTRRLQHLSQTESTQALKAQASSFKAEQLLATAVVTETGRETPESRRLLAFVVGASADVLAIAVSVDTRRGWADDRFAWIETGVPSAVSMSSWSPFRGPIRQIIFHQAARPESDEVSLLVRFESSFAVLTPVFRERGKPIGGWLPSSIFPIGLDRSTCPIRSWRLDSNVVDIAPHPSLSQVVAIDTNGCWTIFEVGNSDSPQTAAPICSQGRVETSDPSSKRQGAETSSKYQIYWPGPGRLLVIFTEVDMKVYAARGGQGVLESHTFRDSNSSQQVRAVKQSVRSSTEYVVVSSSCVHVMILVEQGESDEPRLYETARWRHFLDLQQNGVRIGFISDAGGDSVAIYVPGHPFALHYQLRRTDNFSNELSVTLSPCAFDIDKELQNLPLTDIVVLPCEVRSTYCAQADCLGRTYRNAGCRFYQMFVLDSAGSLRSFLYCCNGAKGAVPEIEPLAWIFRQRRRKVRGDKYIGDAFVVSDDDVDSDASEDMETTNEALLKRFNVKGETGSIAPADLDRPTHSFEWLYHIVSGIRSGEDDVQTIINRIDAEADALNADEPRAARLLLSASPDQPELREIEASTAALSVWLASRSTENSESLGSALQATALPISFFGTYERISTAEGGTSLASLYRTCLENWVRPLPGSVSSAVRLAKERVARYVAISISLASIRIEQPGIPPASEGQPSALNNTSQHEAGSSQTIAIRSSPSLPSQESTTQAKPSEPTYTSTPVAAAVSRLSRYASIAQPSPTHPAMLPILTRLQDAWKPGVPVDVGLISVRGDADASGSAMTAEARARELPRQEKRKQQEARRSLSAKRLRVGGRSVPGFGGPVAASSPGKPPAHWMSSQSQGQSQEKVPLAVRNREPAEVGALTGQAESEGTQSAAAVASQVEPGRHGGRPIGLPVRKKPTRRPGF